ncbi:LysM peptidoglycan-binding domain-containing protein [Paenibacillus amylolyticus]|uniref:LysM peptidoglycan-binding domain-containing protein n=1 Tax=Paenibacillus amylolyticus TaxID=1451 RepID=UPI00201DB85B|nr:LysM domain-containing protein [Paenibacillus amylolyticus]MCL6663486.1 LysM peptidoglycan-binding domain-containing protein [Paenibacillus amylolyticus]
MSFFKINRKKDPLLSQQDSDIFGESASDPDSNIVEVEHVKPLKTMLKGEFPQKEVNRAKIRQTNIASIVTIASVTLFFVLFFTLDLPGKILSAKVSQPVTAVSSVSSNDQLDTEHSPSSPHIVVLPGSDVTKDDLLSYLADMPDDDVQTLLETIQAQKNGKINSSDAGKSSSENEVTSGTVSSSVSVPPSVDPDTSLGTAQVATDIETKRLFSVQVDGSKRLRLVQDLNASDYLYYVAEDGDTLLALSNAFGVSLGQLLELNALHDADVIRAGQILIFPGETKQPELNGE